MTMAIEKGTECRSTYSPTMVDFGKSLNFFYFFYFFSLLGHIKAKRNTGLSQVGFVRFYNLVPFTEAGW